MTEAWNVAVFAARRHHNDEDTTKGSLFVYTNSNNTRGEFGKGLRTGVGGQARVDSQDKLLQEQGKQVGFIQLTSTLAIKCFWKRSPRNIIC